MGVITKHLGQCLQLGNAIHSAAGIVRAVQNDPLGPWRYGVFKFSRGQLETVAFVAMDNDRRAAIQASDIGVRNPVRRVDDDLVVRVEGGRQRFKNNLLAARPGHHLFEAVLQGVVTRQLGHDGMAQQRCPKGAGVMSIAGRHGLARRLNDMRRRVEIRLTHGEVHNVLTLCPQLRHQGVGSHTRGRGNTQDPLGQKRVFHFIFFSPQTDVSQSGVDRQGSADPCRSQP